LNTTESHAIFVLSQVFAPLEYPQEMPSLGRAYESCCTICPSSPLDERPNAFLLAQRFFRLVHTRCEGIKSVVCKNHTCVDCWPGGTGDTKTPL